MHPTTPFFRGIVLTAVLILISVTAFADTIRLKDGSIIKGKIVRFSGGTFSVEIGEGARMRKMTFSVDDVESISFDSPMFPTNTARVNQPKDPIVKVSDNLPTSSQPRVITSDPTPPRNNDNNSQSTATSTNPRVVTTDSTPVKKNETAKTDTSSEPQAVEDPDPAPVTKVPASQPQKSSPPAKNPTTQPKVSAPSKSTAAGADPIELNIKVLADNTANGWTNSGWVVKKGQRIHITADGQVSLGKGKLSSASGLPDLADDGKLLKAAPTGALIAVIGDDNNDFLYIGSEREFTASRDGTLFLGVNEGNLDDNAGSFAVKVQILPTGGK